MRIQRGSRVVGLLVAVALAAACAHGPKHVATVASSGAQSAFLLAREAEQRAFDAGAITPEKHLELLLKLRKAFTLHQDAVKLILATPPKGSPPSEYAAMAAQALVLISDVIDALPAGAPKNRAASALVKGGF